MGASTNGLGGAEAPEPPSRLGPADAIPSADRGFDPYAASDAMARRVLRALDRGTGCYLTAEMVAALDRVMGDGEWWQDMYTPGQIRRAEERAAKVLD